MVFALAGCDIPTSGPSLETETGVNSPVVMNKTFSLLGSTDSPHEPLIDTTTSEFDSLFTVADSDQSISIEEEVSSFDLGSVDQALDEATTGLGVDAAVEKSILEGSGLGTQNVSAQLTKENSVPPPTQSATTTKPAQDAVIPFPASFLDVPSIEAANIDADKVKTATFTDELSYQGGPVNRITFRLRNEDASSPTLTDGRGNPPRVRLTDETGTLIADRSFGAKIGPGESGTVEVRVDGETLGENAEIGLTVDGHDPTEDKLDVNLSPLRYREALLGGVTNVGIAASDTLSTQDGSGSAQFAGITGQGGTLQIEVSNQFAFPIQVDDLRLTNHLQNSALPDSFPALSVSRQEPFIPAGGAETFTVDLAGRGMAEEVAVQLDGGLGDDRQDVRISASDRLSVSAGGGVTVGALYFWPNGEEVSASGAVPVGQDRISFDRPEDFVELREGTLALTELANESTIQFESLSLTFPDLTRQGAPLTVSLQDFPRTIEEDLSGARLSPTQNEIAFTLDGTLETVSNQTSSTLRVVRAADRVRTEVSVRDLSVHALEATVAPFSVNVTEDANGDGQLDLTDDREARQVSFGGFGGLPDRVEGLELTGTELTVRTTTDLGTDVQLVAALQGRGGETRPFLAGEDPEKSVSAASAMGDDFYKGSAQIANENLIQLGIDAAPGDDPVSRRVQLTPDNSTVDAFLNEFPSSLRFLARAHLTGDENGRIHLRRPLTFETELNVSVPVQVQGGFAIRDTIEADFSALSDATDPSNDVTVSNAELRIRYANGIPLGANAELIVLDGRGTTLLTLPGTDDTLRLKAPEKAEDGTADGSRTGTSALNLSTDQLRALADGQRVALRLTMDQSDIGGAATLRATDTIELSLEAKIETSVSVNN
jgi:hypothetical protein